MYDAHTTPSEPSLLASIIRLFEAGQRVVLDRLDLAYFDLAQLATRTLRGAALIAIGAVLLTGAWFTVMGGAVVWLQQYMSLAASLALVAATSAVLGGGALAVGLRRARAGAVEAAGDLIEDVRDGGTPAQGVPQP
jgi:hypothetical protein